MTWYIMICVKNFLNKYNWEILGFHSYEDKNCSSLSKDCEWHHNADDLDLNYN